MCRIAGIIDFTGSLNKELEKKIILMRDSMTHGGPDDAGIYISPDNKVAFGNRRLAIIDLSSSGHQPMINNEGTLCITYNGEIYNFLELRDELIHLGYEFKSKSDAEVILNGYAAWGIEKLLSKLRGMFAFAIYDRRDVNNAKLYLARDRLGIKPLYYFYDKKKLIFASEIKALIRSGLIPCEVNQKASTFFLQLGSIPTPMTTLKEVVLLSKAHYIEIVSERFDLKKYWELKDLFEQGETDENILQEELISKTSDIFEEAVRLHLISDAPLGIFLSGGLDSSSLVAIASMYKNPITTLSVIFKEKDFDESKYARLVAVKYNTCHKEVLIEEKDFFSEIPSILNAMDEPTVDGVNTYFISKAARDAGLKTVLSGIGGDELFLGYNHFSKAGSVGNIVTLFRYVPPKLRESVIKTIIKMNKGLAKIDLINNPTPKNAYLLFRGLFTPMEIMELTGVSKSELESYDDMFNVGSLSFNSMSKYFDYLEYEHYLQDQLLKDTDFMSMMHAVEVRVPFLDHKLVEYVIGTGLNFKMLTRKNKFLLLKIMDKKLPLAIKQRKKAGFIFPFAEWIKKYSEYFQAECINNSLLNKSYVNKIWEDFKMGNIHWSRPWALFIHSKKFSLRKEKVLV